MSVEGFSNRRMKCVEASIVRGHGVTCLGDCRARYIVIAIL
jgi:hypothetical protein